MCLPPFCSPAQGCFGCGSLRRGATVVLVLNGLYGLVMIMLHAYLLSEENDSKTPGQKEYGQAPVRALGEFNWFLQVVDMDLSWGHRLMGFKDDQCLLAGLLYGVAVSASCTLALSSVVGREDDQSRLLEVGGGPGGWGRGRGAEIYRPWLPKWFIVFAHSQLITYIFQVMTKFTELCDLRHDYFPSLEANCSVLSFQYAQRAFLGAAASTLGLYILGSFAYLGQAEEGRSVGPRLAVIDEERPGSQQPRQKIVHSSAWTPAMGNIINRQPVSQYSQYQPVNGTDSLSGSSTSSAIFSRQTVTHYSQHAPANGTAPPTPSEQCSDPAISWTQGPPRQALMR